MAIYVRHPTEQRILDDRERLKIPPVHHGRMPQSIASYVRRVMKAEGFKFASWQRTTNELLCILHQQHDTLFDHVGQSVNANGRECFCCEPYAQVPGVHEAAQRFADRFRLRLAIGEHSWHFPGRTIQFQFTLPDCDA